MSDFLGESRTAVVTILDRAGQGDDDALELIDLPFQLSDPKLCSHQRLQRGSLDWCGRDVVGPGIERPLAQRLVGRRNQEHDRSITGCGSLLDGAADLDAVHIGQHGFAQHEVHAVRDQ